MANQALLADNASAFARRARAAPRAGAALLAGLVVCGHCGRQMHVAYKPQPRYLCQALSKTYAGPSCLHLDGASIDAAVVQAFFQAMQPAELDLLDELLAEQQAEQARLVQQHADQVARATYEARLAQRQYDAIDPENRLVAAELERRWELALRALAEAREAAERFAQQPPTPQLDPVLRRQLQDLGQHLPTLWASGRLSTAQKKELLRSLIRRVILARPTPDTVEVKVVWVSGAFSTLSVHPVIHRATDVSGYDQFVERVVALAAEGYQDGQIARQLTAEGFRSARNPAGVPTVSVGKVRRALAQPSLTTYLRHQPKLGEQWTVWGLCRVLNVTRNWLYDRIRQGTVPATRHPHTGYYLIADDPDLVAALQRQVPERRRRLTPAESASTGTATDPIGPAGV
jgi:hypothetical protein